MIWSIAPLASAVLLQMSTPSKCEPVCLKPRTSFERFGERLGFGRSVNDADCIVGMPLRSIKFLREYF
ncbi:MAG: hypothetical protein Ct9H300mP32_0080 [Verrucomicrobiota bacterium]|nr:MAG: hypothetical protein Ct9H300mP32_0080 [Verrucomicrobiota bacterium]